MKNQKILSILDIKQALKDERFRNLLPPELENLVSEFVKNPACPCHTPLYKKIAKDCKPILQSYFPNKDIVELENAIEKDNWIVINCHISELEENLKKLPMGRKQLKLARFEDQITVVIKELDLVY